MVGWNIFEMLCWIRLSENFLIHFKIQNKLFVLIHWLWSTSDNTIVKGDTTETFKRNALIEDALNHQESPALFDETAIQLIHQHFSAETPPTEKKECMSHVSQHNPEKTDTFDFYGKL